LLNKAAIAIKTSDEAAVRLVGIEIVTAALCQTLGMYGFVLFLVERRTEDLYILMGLALICFFAYFPKFNVWKEWIGKNVPAA
jgi:hypothetical protein